MVHITIVGNTEDQAMQNVLNALLDKRLIKDVEIKTDTPTPAVPVAAAPIYTHDQIMAAGAALISAGKMPELIGLLSNYGVQAVQQLKPDQLGAFATDLRKLGATL